MSSITSFPLDLVSLIVSFLPPHERFIHVSHVSRDWRRASYSPIASYEPNVDSWMTSYRPSFWFHHPWSIHSLREGHWIRLRHLVGLSISSTPSRRFVRAMSVGFGGDDEKTSQLMQASTNQTFFPNLIALHVGDFNRRSRDRHRYLFTSLASHLRILDAPDTIPCHIGLLVHLRALTMHTPDDDSIAGLLQLHELEDFRIRTVNGWPTCDAIRTLIYEHRLRYLVVLLSMDMDAIHPPRDAPPFFYSDRPSPLIRFEVAISGSRWDQLIVRTPELTISRCARWSIGPSNRSPNIECALANLTELTASMPSYFLPRTKDAFSALGLCTNLRSLDLYFASPSEGVRSLSDPAEESIWQALGNMRELQHLHIQLKEVDDSMIPKIVSTLSDRCQHLRTFTFDEPKFCDLWTEENVSLLANLPQFERLGFIWPNQAYQYKKPVQKPIFDISTAQLRSISRSHSWHSIHVMVQMASDRWMAAPQTDQRLSQDLDYEHGTLKHVRVHWAAPTGVSIYAIQKSVSSAIDSRCVVSHRWEDGNGQPRKEVKIEPKRCSMM